ncbi:hypothetical protein GCM10009122_03480 [Fulvivirga kasyanovii]|uniref:Esterase n=1 Tax=Fulvivirga kasyanovii TaxID=396812 RepID=A0ABW9RSS9_9BACT|nr:alpha/beta hydrolase-fold protein [Fulvivirga kasyanovii]MTI26890.1 esterase [Fulvivirga kasyanovii]
MNKYILTAFLIISLVVKARSQNSLTAGEQYTLNSEILNTERNLFVYLPPDYGTNENKHYPTLYIMDGHWYFFAGVAIQKTLRGEELLPEMIIVGVDMPRPERDSIFSNQWDDFQQFIKQEVVPFVDSNFRTQDERLLFGWESCGALVCQLLLDRDQMFDAAIASNGAHISQEMMDEFAKQNNSATEKYLFIANSVKDIYNIDSSEDAAAKLKKGNLPNLVWEYRLFNDEIHESMPYTSMYQGLKYYYHNYGSLIFSSVKAFHEYGGVPAVKGYFKQRGERFGVPESIDDNTKNSLIWLAWYRDDFETFQLLMSEFSDVLSTRRYASAYWQNRFGQYYLKHKDFENAIRYFNEGITRYPDDNFMAQMYSGLGTAYLSKGNRRLARSNYEKAVAAAEITADPKIELYRSQWAQLK